MNRFHTYKPPVTRFEVREKHYHEFPDCRAYIVWDTKLDTELGCWPYQTREAAERAARLCNQRGYR